MVTLPDVSRILVIRYGRLGDLVLLIPALRALRRRFPAAHISALADQRYSPVLEMCSAVDRVIASDRIGMRDSPWWSGALNALRSAHGLRKSPLRPGDRFPRFSGNEPAGLVQPGLLAHRPQEERALLPALLFQPGPRAGGPEPARGRSLRFPAENPGSEPGEPGTFSWRSLRKTATGRNDSCGKRGWLDAPA